MEPMFFSTPEEFRNWLTKNHRTSTELLVGYWKVGTKRPSMTWSESVDQALCFGWIDGVRRTIDDDSFSIRFSPRRPESPWSASNTAKVAELESKGLMRAAGRAAFARRNDERARAYSYENGPKEFDADLVRIFKKSKEAWEFYQGQPSGYRKKIVHWVMSAKQAETRVRRLQRLIQFCAEGKRLY
jgi:uncharacterized protein YdeI (YjbR/CyaY-like superfamily)